LSTRNGKPHQQIINAAKSPTNLKRHIERWHPSEFREMNEAQKLGHTLETVAKKHIHTAKSSQVGIAQSTRGSTKFNKGEIETSFMGN
jgi:hypothetical protein